MKTILQYTSNRQKALVRQAMSLEDPEHAVRKGWIYAGKGLACVVYAKRNIVVKFYNSTDYIKNTVSIYFNILPYHRKYFTRILAYDDDKIVQPRVTKTASDDGIVFTIREKAVINRLLEYYNFYDFDSEWNVGRLNGKISIYDLSHESPIY